MDAGPDFGILLILGIGVFGGILGAWLFQHLRIPQVIGYIAIGLLIGESGFGVIRQASLPGLRPFSYMALAVIGFLVGGELEAKTFRKYGHQFLAMMFGEGLGAFLLVGTVSGLLLAWVTGDFRIALAGGVVFGAISSATDPASTLDVLWENRGKGLLTTSLIAVVALDDALAMLLYAMGTAVASLLAGGDSSPVELLTGVVLHLGGSSLLGASAGWLLDTMLRHSRSPERSLTLIIGSLLMMAGICLSFHLDVILCAMSTGIVLVNRSPKGSESVFKSVRAFASPIQVMFFVLVGARLHLGALPGFVWALVLIYVLGRSAGKYFGTLLGGSFAGCDPVVRKNLGLGLLAQGGVAVGLSMMASQHLKGMMVLEGLDLGTLVVSTVTTTTLLVQLIGPPCVRLALRRGGEAGRNVTEEDIIAELTVGDVMNREWVSFRDFDLISQVFERVTRERQLIFPVISAKGACTGVISLESIRSLFLEREIWDWMIAEDVMSPCEDLISRDLPLEEGLRRMHQNHQDQLVIRDTESGRVEGLFDLRQIRRELTRRLIARQGQAPHAGGI